MFQKTNIFNILSFSLNGINGPLNQQYPYSGIDRLVSSYSFELFKHYVLSNLKIWNIHQIHFQIDSSGSSVCNSS